MDVGSVLCPVCRHTTIYQATFSVSNPLTQNPYPNPHPLSPKPDHSTIKSYPLMITTGRSYHQQIEWWTLYQRQYFTYLWIVQRFLCGNQLNRIHQKHAISEEIYKSIKHLSMVDTTDDSIKHLSMVDTTDDSVDMSLFLSSSMYAFILFLSNSMCTFIR